MCVCARAARICGSIMSTRVPLRYAELYRDARRARRASYRAVPRCQMCDLLFAFAVCTLRPLTTVTQNPPSSPKRSLKALGAAPHSLDCRLFPNPPWSSCESCFREFPFARDFPLRFMSESPLIGGNPCPEGWRARRPRQGPAGSARARACCRASCRT